tara:strand:- start:1523 stop:1963 length:441 start_codon:yes stop_codon:yes gene_type:complete
MNSFDKDGVGQITDRVIIYIIVMIVFTLIVDLLKIDNHFSNLNADSSIMDSLYLVSMTFTGSGYGGIYAQTALSRFVMVLLSFVKFLLIAEAFGSIIKDDKDTYEGFIKKLFSKDCAESIRDLRNTKTFDNYAGDKLKKLQECFKK